MSSCRNKLGTAAHIGRLETEKKQQRLFDGLEDTGFLMEDIDPQMRKENMTSKKRRELRRKRNEKDAYLPPSHTDEITGEQEKGPSKTFSHHHQHEMSKRELKRYASHAQCYPNQLNRAGVNDIITIVDGDHKKHQRTLAAFPTDDPPVFRMFRGARLGEERVFNDEKFRLIEIRKGNLL